MDEKDIEAAYDDTPSSEGVERIYDPTPPFSIGSSNYDDPSSKIWSVYISEASVHDKALVESRKSDMDGILIFAGLFSANVTAFIVESYKNLIADSGDITVALLTQISQQLRNTSQATTPLATESFQPTPSALRVNAFWILSLCFALLCALAATLIQQWARNYLQAIERRPTPHKKARIRAFLFQGVESFNMSAVVDGIPTLLHISVFLFFLGLADFFSSINRAIGRITLIIILFSFSLYLLITLLPVLRHNCPYRTPLSGICWRIMQFMGLLRYKHHDIWRRIRGSMAQGREMLAAVDIPGRDQRDFEALCWTMESLTEDSELEPFVEGIPGFLQLSSQGAPSVVQKLMRRDDVAIFERVTKLLKTCMKSGGLAGPHRRRRAVACMNAISALVMLADNEDWTSLDFFDDDLRYAFSTLKDDNDFAISDAALTNIEVLAAKLQRDIKAGFDKPHPSSSVAIAHSLATTSALDTLYEWGSLDPIIEKIAEPTTAATRGPTQNVVLTCRTRYIPDLLSTCYGESPLEEEERETRALACMKVISYSTGLGNGPAFDLTALAILRKDKTAAIAHFATCTTARVACQLQSDVVQTLWNQRYIGSLAHTYETLDQLGFLNELTANNMDNMGSRLDHGGSDDLLSQLSCFSSPSDDELRDVRAFAQGKVDQIAQLCHLLQPDELQCLEKLECRPSKRKSLAKCTSHGKVALSRGHIVVLISLLYYMKTASIPAEELEYTLETLQFVAHNLTARFSSRMAQASVVDLAGQYIHLHRPTHADNTGSSTTDEPGTGEIIMDIIFDILGTIGDPKVINNVKGILNNYLAIIPSNKAAANALRKLEETEPLEPLD